MNSIKTVMGVIAALALQGCEQAAGPSDTNVAPVSQAELQQFVETIKDNLVFVEGGEFLMGDFGPQYAPERAPYDMDPDSKPLHKVELSSYSINRYKVTNLEYQLYLRVRGLKLGREGGLSEKDWIDISASPASPAHVNWYEAEKYCSWLASVTELSFVLPTEAQWEYAARSRGQFLMVATDDGTYKAEPYSLITESYDPKGINISTDGDRVDFAKKMGWKTEYYTPLPVDKFPPQPIGSLFNVG